MVNVKTASNLPSLASGGSILCVLLTALLAAGTFAENLNENTLTIRFPTAPTDSIYKSQGNYHRKVLELILGKTGRKHKVESVSVPLLPASRVVRHLDNNIVNVVVFHTDPQKEAELIPIRIPVYRGLSGWRLLFIHKQNQARFSQVNTLEQLKKLTAGQGDGWPDNIILQQAGINVFTAPHRNNLLKMLDHGRIDFFPRGTFEIWNEASIPESDNLVIENHLIIHYPTAFYIFVSQSKPELAKLLERGFEVALKDGSFRKLFYDSYGERIRLARIRERTLITLPNPTLTPETPLNDKRLWYKPGDF